MSRSTNIWMPLYVADYLADTRRLTTEQHGAYLLLIMEYWQKGAPLPDDDKQLAQITGLGRRWGNARKTVQQFFTVGEGVWKHARIEEEKGLADHRRAKASENGGKGGRPKNPTRNPAETPRLSEPEPKPNPATPPDESSSQSQYIHTHTARGLTPAWSEVEAFALASQVDVEFARDWFERKVNNLTHGFDTLVDWRADLLPYWRRNGGGAKTPAASDPGAVVNGHGRPKSFGAEAMDLKRLWKILTDQVAAHPANENSAAFAGGALADTDLTAYRRLQAELREVEAALRSIPKDTSEGWMRDLRRQAFERACSEHPGNPESTAYDERYVTAAQRNEYLTLRRECGNDRK